MTHAITRWFCGLSLALAGCGAPPSGGTGADSTSTSLTSGGGSSSLSYSFGGLLALDLKPIVFAHEGDGENLANAAGQPADPSRPINDTVDAVRLGYANGASVVEVDVEITQDGQPVANHDFDFLPDGTCINSYTLDQLQQHAPYIPSLEGVLNQAKRNNRGSPHTSGLMVIELKTPSPRCDPNDTSKPALVQAAVDTVRRLRMQDAVLFDGFSPDVVALAAAVAPEIPRELDLDMLQLLTPDQVTAATGLTVKTIAKSDFNLTWAELGDVYRLPGYVSPLEFLRLAYFLGARVVDYELDFLGTFDQLHAGNPAIPDGAGWVAIAHQFGFKVAADPARTIDLYLYFAYAGADYIYTDPVADAVALQPALP
jgi:glycerophosphoryl diester phosphodiesterase